MAPPRLSAAALVALVSLAGCLADRTFGPDSDIPCEVQEDCPVDFVCALAQGRCRPADALDVTAPTIVAATVTPERIGGGDEVILRLVASEPLGPDPAVTSNATDQFAVVEAETDRAAGSYALRLRAERSEDGEYPIFATLEDVVGNRAQDLRAGVFRVDTVGPRPIDTQVEVSVLPLELVEVIFMLDEPLSELPGVDLVPPTLDIEPLSMGVTHERDGSYTALTTLTGDEPRGPWEVIVVALDLAGNRSDTVLASGIMLDQEQ